MHCVRAGAEAWRCAHCCCGGWVCPRAAALVLFVAMQFSPKPGVWMIRWLFERGAAEAVASMAAFEPQGVTAQRDVVYAPQDPDARLDVYWPEGAADPGGRPTIVWVHGGAYVSGSRADVGPYLRLLAAQGYTTVAVGYSLAPTRRYPTPLRQLDAALAYLNQHAATLQVDPQRLFLAGDSAGAQIVAQYAALLGRPELARAVGVEPGVKKAQLRGLLLYCGPHDGASIRLEGAMGWFLRTVLWAYLGERDARNDPRLGQMTIHRHLTTDYPPMFITAGQADPLEPHSRRLATAALALGIEVDSLLFPADHEPALPHEYQFQLAQEDAQKALRRTLALLARHR